MRDILVQKQFHVGIVMTLHSWVNRPALEILEIEGSRGYSDELPFPVSREGQARLDVIRGEVREVTDYLSFGHS